jgi:hypothetical protein
MLEEKELALARADHHVVEARGFLLDHKVKVARLKSLGENSVKAEQDLGLFGAYLFIIERHRDFLLRNKQQRPGKW